MQEPALSFEGVTVSPQKETVRIFYKDMWDHADKSLIPKNFPRRLHLSRLPRADTRRPRSIGWLCRLGDRGTRAIHHRHSGYDRRGQPCQRQDAFPRLSSAGIVRCGTEWSPRMVDWYADFHVRRPEGARLVRPRRHLWPDRKIEGSRVKLSEKARMSAIGT
jgi:hypothetical protein